MANKKMSEFDTKSFLGGAGAATNSYILINYEDDTTNAPVTYKANLQEIGKAIANDLKLPSVTVNEGAITNFKVKGVSNGAYTETVVAAPYDGPSMGAISDTVDTAISGLASTGYVTNAVAGRALPGASSEYVMGIINSHSLVSEGYVTDAIAGFASTGYVQSELESAINIVTSDMSQMINDYLVEQEVTWHHDDAPDETVKVLFYDDYGKIMMKDSSNFTPLPHIAYLSTSDQKTCIRDGDGIFQGFLSST